MVKTALITGITGFIGSHLAKRLVKDGWRVHAIVRTSSNYDLIRDIRDVVCFHTYDENITSMQTILADSQPDVIFHLASLFLAQHKAQDITPLIQSNITFGSHLAEAAVTSNCMALINIGTSWQHYDNECYNPVNLYAAMKQAFEDILKYYAEAHELKVITLKLFDTYGPDDPRPKLMNLLKRAATTGEDINMSPGEQMIDLVHVDDVVEACCTAQKILSTTKEKTMLTYGVSSGTPLSLRQLVERLEAEMNVKINVQWGGRPYRPREVMRPWHSYETLPGWTPKTKKLF